MGKSEKQNAHRQQSREPESRFGSSGLLCHRCSVARHRVAKEFSFKCFFILVLTLSLLAYGIFSILPFHSTMYGFDAKDAIKLSGISLVLVFICFFFFWVFEHVGMLYLAAFCCVIRVF
jgi:hypothetical protein